MSSSGGPLKDAVWGEERSAAARSEPRERPRTRHSPGDRISRITVERGRSPATILHAKHPGNEPKAGQRQIQRWSRASWARARGATALEHEGARLARECEMSQMSANP